MNTWWKRFLKENALIPLGLILILIWVPLELIDLGIRNPDLKFALNAMALTGCAYGVWLLFWGFKEYLWWKKDTSNGTQIGGNLL